MSITMHWENKGSVLSLIKVLPLWSDFVRNKTHYSLYVSLQYCFEVIEFFFFSKLLSLVLKWKYVIQLCETRAVRVLVMANKKIPSEPLLKIKSLFDFSEVKNDWNGFKFFMCLMQTNYIWWFNKQISALIDGVVTRLFKHIVKTIQQYTDIKENVSLNN